MQHFAHEVSYLFLVAKRVSDSWLWPLCRRTGGVIVVEHSLRKLEAEGSLEVALTRLWHQKVARRKNPADVGWVGRRCSETAEQLVNSERWIGNSLCTYEQDQYIRVPTNL